MKRILTLVVLVLGIALLAAACGDDDDNGADTASEPGTIVVVAEEGGFSTLVTAVEAADLTETLNGEGPYTVFAPTDEAFAALPEGTLDSLLADPDALANILTYHVVSGDVKAADVVGLESAETVQGESIDIAVDGETVTLNDVATVTTTDIEASNGTIHAIDTVLIPPGS